MNRFLISPLIRALLLFCLFGVIIATAHVIDSMVDISFIGNLSPEIPILLLFATGIIGLAIFRRKKSKLKIFHNRK